MARLTNSDVERMAVGLSNWSWDAEWIGNADHL